MNLNSQLAYYSTHKLIPSRKSSKPRHLHLTVILLECISLSLKQPNNCSSYSIPFHLDTQEYPHEEEESLSDLHSTICRSAAIQNKSIIFSIGIAASLSREMQQHFQPNMTLRDVLPHPNCWFVVPYEVTSCLSVQVHNQTKNLPRDRE